MIYFLYGNDWEKARKKLNELLDILAKKKPNASLFKMDDETWSEAQFEELLGGQGLFEKKYIVVFDKVFTNKEAKESVLEKLKELKDSENVFLFLEEKVDKPTLSRIEKVAEKVQSFEKIGEKGRQFGLEGGKFFPISEFNIFSISDAFGRRDKKDLWILFRKACERNIAPEEIHGLIFWQLKNMAIVKQLKTPVSSGLKPFVFQRASSFAKNYSDDEIRKISSELANIYHNSRRGLADFETALEMFILSM
jgi:DNA polymerase III delta subunit